MKTQTITEAQKPTMNKAALAAILTVVLFDVMGLSILFPVQAYIVRQYSDQAIMVTLIPGLYAAAQFIGAPVLGKLSDRFGRRPVLLVSMLGSAAGYFLFGIGGALWVLFLSRLIDGFTGGNISTATAYVADITPPQDRAKTFGLVGAAFGFGFILGPALGGALGEISLSAPVFAAGIFALIETVVCFFVLKESLPVEKRSNTPLRLKDLNPLSSIGGLLGRPRLGLILIAQGLFNFAFSGFNGILPVSLIDRFQIEPWQLAALLVAGGLANVVVQAGLVGSLTQRFGEKNIAVMALGIQALANLGIAVVPVLGLMYPLIFLNTSGSGFFYPTIGALLANSVTQDELGRANGAGTALGSLMNLFGPLWVGFAYDQIQPELPFWAGAVVLLIAGFLLLRLKAPARAQAYEA